MDNSSLISRIDDAAEIALRREIPHFVGFLSENEACSAEGYAQKHYKNFMVFGGFDNAERMYIGFFPEWSEPSAEIFPITAFTLSFKQGSHVEHRDVLGSLMSYGIERETVGDILIDDKRAVVFINSKIFPYVKEQIRKIGSVGVTLSEGFTLPLPCSSQPVDFTATVASERLDAVIASITNCSRGMASELIDSGFVAVNGIVCEKSTSAVRDGSKITVRGHGKFFIVSIGGCTKKGRLIINARKYI